MANQHHRPPIRPIASTSGLRDQFTDSKGSQGRHPSPEVRSTRLPRNSTAHEHSQINSVWISFIAVCTALGLASIAVADGAGMHGDNYSTALVFFFVGLILIFLPIAARVLMQDVDRRERLALIILLGLALYTVKILGSPSAFTFIDEYIHLRNAQDILRTHHLFTLNPILPTAAYYPGLAGATAGLVNLTGLSPFIAGLIIIAAARVLISVSFFFVAEKVTGSGRAAGCASLIYAANPMFLFWSSSFSYEDLALPLAAFVVWWIGRTRRETGRLVPIVTIIVIVAVVVTHHIAAFALTALLGAWWLAELLLQRSTARRRGVGLMTLVAGSASLAWFFFIARPAASYLFGENIQPALQETAAIVLRHATPRHLYGGGSAAPVWYMLAGFVAVGLIMSALPLGIYRAWKIAFDPSRARHYERRRIYVPMVIAMAVAVAFPFSLLPRLTANGGAVSSRSSEYIFTGLGCVLALLVEQAPRSRRGRSKAARDVLMGGLRTLVTAGAVTMVFIGDVTIGTAYGQLLPESSHPQGYPWTIQPEVISASEWAREHLGTDQRFGTDLLDSLALASYGEQDTVPEQSVWPIFLTKTMNNTVVHDIRTLGIRFLLVNWQMTQGLPTIPGDYYFSPWEPQANDYKQPFPVAMLRKFSSTDCTNLIYNSGPIQIVNVTRIEDGSCVPRTAGSTQDGSASP